MIERGKGSSGCNEGLSADKEKRKGEVVEESRGVTLTPALYKIYVAIIGERLEKEVEEKRLIPQNQAGFRKELGTMDNIYALNYLVNS